MEGSRQGLKRYREVEVGKSEDRGLQEHSRAHYRGILTVLPIELGVQVLL